MMTTRGWMFLVLGLACVLLVIIIVSLAYQTQTGTCPADYQAQPPLILVSMDGFRASYRERGITPTIEKFAEEGVSAPFMLPSFTTKTLPNHYTIVTGLYPETHGIVANAFYDSELGKFTPDDKNGSWFGGVPIWNTIVEQGMKSATYFWIGSDSPIGGKRPTYWYLNNHSVPFEDRVDQVLAWVKMGPEKRPAFITLYFHEPDLHGHQEGPDSDGVNEQLKRMDGMIKRLVTGLEEAELLNCVNIILVSDHGMATGGDKWRINLSEYIPPADISINYTGSFTMLTLKDRSEAAKKAALEKMACNRTGLRVYAKEGLPKRLHFGSNGRIGDIVFDMDPGLATSVGAADPLEKGHHGYDNYFRAMTTIFLARGPGFKTGVVTRPFHNIQLYNVMCHLTGIPPELNNGTAGALNDILASPGPVEALPQVIRPPVPDYPGDEELTSRLKVSGCPGDLSSYEDWLSVLKNTDEQQKILETHHAPWGLPQIRSPGVKLLLLHQPDHVTGYSASQKTPLWASFTLDSGSPGVWSEEQWSSDVRLKDDASATCKQYEDLADAITAPLFHPGFLSNSSFAKIPYMMSNAVASTQKQQKRCNYLMQRLVTKWRAEGGLNLVVGPVFDFNADSVADPFNASRNYPERPSDRFAIVTRCSGGTNITACEPQHLNTRAFIFPTEELVDNCIEEYEYASKFSCTVQDVKAAAGFAFFPDLSNEERVRLETSVHQEIW